MRTISDYLRNIKFVQNTLWEETARISFAKEELIISMNTEEQMFRDGEDAHGKSLGEYEFTYDYGSAYGSNPKGYPKRAGYSFNFYDTGELYSAMKLRMQGDKLFIDNSDPKVLLLEDKWGVDFIGLNENNKERLNWDILYPEILEYCKKYM